MRIGLIDADLLDNGTRHPNLALMKISAFEKEKGNNAALITNYDDIGVFDKLYLSKVFSSTYVPINLDDPRVVYGGTGFFFDKAPNLPDTIEHHMPDYHLYDDFVNSSLAKGMRKIDFRDYLDYSIGFTTRGCFRKCSFCVNRKYNNVFRHSHVLEFFDPLRKYICLWDDNILGFSGWENVFDELAQIDRPFQFRQGLDIRLLDDRKASKLSIAKYRGDYIFAFDFVEEEMQVRKGLEIWRKFSSKSTKLYLLCAFKSIDISDIFELFYRIQVLMSFGCLPYIMRYENWKLSKYAGMYLTIARWCNQPAIFKKMSFRQFCEANGDTSSSMRYFRWFLDNHPDFPTKYLDMRFEEQNMYK